MLNLLAKDFKLLFGRSKNFVVSLILTIVFISLFIALEVFLYITILQKIKTTNNAPIAFTNLFLFVLTIIIIISSVVSANKLFFNEKDIEQLNAHPVDEIQIVASKTIFLFLTHYALSFVTSFPIFIAYAAIFPKTMMFYYLAIFYPIITFFFEVGIALIIVYPFYLLKKFLNKHLVIRFIIIAIVLFGLCFAYVTVLNVFVDIVIGGNFNYILTKVPNLVNASKYFFPTNFIVNAMFSNIKRYYLPYITIGIGLFIFGFALTIFTFNYVKNITYYTKQNQKEKKMKVRPVTLTLINKEIKLLTKNFDYSFSFLGLLVIAPLLSFLVIKAVNQIFTTGVFAYYISLVPNFIPLFDILILMFFTVVIAQGASTYIQMEKKTIKVMKTIPVSPKKQIMIKVLIPFCLSFVSFFVSILVLLITNIISFITFVFGLLLVTTLLAIYNCVSLKEELKIRNHKPRQTYVSNLYAYLLPVLYFIVTAFLSFYNLPLVIAYVIGLLVLIIVYIINSVILNKKMISLFMDLDVIN